MRLADAIRAEIPDPPLKYALRPPGYEDLAPKTWLGTCSFCGCVITRSFVFERWARREPGEMEYVLDQGRLFCRAPAARVHPRDAYGLHHPEGIVQ